MLFQTLSKTRQEDAHELLLALLDAVERDTKKGIAVILGAGSKVCLRVFVHLSVRVSSQCVMNLPALHPSLAKPCQLPFFKM